MIFRRFCWALILLQTPWLVLGQSKSTLVIDSLAMVSDSLREIAKPNWDSIYVFTLSKTVEQMAYKHDPRAGEYLEHLESYSLSSNYRVTHGLYLRAKARVLDRSGKNAEALQSYLQAIDSLKETTIGADQLAMTYVYAAFLLSNSGSPGKCIDMLEEARPIAESAEDPLPLYYILDYLGDYNYYSSFGVQNFPVALNYYKGAEELIDSHRLELKRSDNYLGQADAYYRLKDFEKGDYYWNKADSIASSQNDYNSLYGIYIDKSEIFLAQGRQDSAIALAELGYEFAKKAGWPELKARAESQLYWIHRSIGDYKTALNYFEQYAQTQDSMNKQELLNQFSELEARYESEKKEQVITELQNQNLRQTRNFLMGIVALGLLLIALGIWTILRLDRDNKLLVAKNKEILHAQIRGQTLERKRVASEIHDNLNTKVAAIRWQLQALEQVVEPPAKAILESSLKLINDVYGDIRLISHNLMPEEIESIGLVETLSNLVGQLNINNRVQFHLIAKTGMTDLPSGLIYPLYNISFELINNILKHSGAKNAWISLDKTETQAVITVSDDGLGYDQTARPSGVGLKNINSRVENMGGKIDIRSNLNQGTKTVISIPLI